jgi:ABC-type enterochelin transport system permease subunit
MLRSRKLSPGLLLPLYFLGLTLAHMLVEVADRYHYSLIPVLIIIAVLGLTGEERSLL